MHFPIIWAPLQRNLKRLHNWVRDRPACSLGKPPYARNYATFLGNARGGPDKLLALHDHPLQKGLSDDPLTARVLPLWCHIVHGRDHTVRLMVVGAGAIS